MPSGDERSTLLGSTPTEKTQQREAKKTVRPVPRKATRFAPRTQQLESVSETEETSPPSSLRQEYFGVRSYVHTFYEAMAMEEPGRRSKDKGRRLRDCRRRAWRCAYVSGALLLLGGLCVLLVGHLAARRREVVDIQEDIEVVSRAGQAFNRRLDDCKVVGLGLFCAGGALSACALAALAFCPDRRPEEEGGWEDIEEVMGGGPEDPGPRPPAVPVTEEVRAVQPGRTDAEVVCACGAGRT